MGIGVVKAIGLPFPATPLSWKSLGIKVLVAVMWLSPTPSSSCAPLILLASNAATGVKPATVVHHAMAYHHGPVTSKAIVAV